MRINTFQSWIYKLNHLNAGGFVVGIGPYSTKFINGDIIYERPIMWFDDLACYYTGIETVDGELNRTISGRRQFDRAEDAARHLSELILHFIP